MNGDRMEKPTQIPRSLQIAIVIGTMLFCGTCLTSVKKLEYQTSAVGLDPHMGTHPFQKPWFCTCCMFIGEAMSLVVYMIKRKMAPEETACDLSMWGITWRGSLPAVLDLTATGLGSVGLLYVAASTFQMLRGCSILFAAVLTVFWLKRDLDFRQLMGLCLILAAMIIVGYAGVLTADDEDAKDGTQSFGLLGVGLIIFAQLFQASQFIWEEKVMKLVKIPPLLLLGIEGIVGISTMCLVVFPLMLWLPGTDASGTQENIWDTLEMIGNSTALQRLIAVYLVCVVILNCAAVYCTKLLSGVHRTLVQTGLRTMCIWSFGLITYYHTDGMYGEPWAGYLSWFQLLGFAWFLLGSLMYSKMIDLPKSSIDSEYKKLPA